MRRYFLSVLVFAFLLSACAQATSTSQVTVTPKVTVTLMPAQTLIPKLTPPSTIIPALSPEAAKTQLLEWLKTNNSCELPCWWGITPGRSTPSDAYDILIPYRDFADRNHDLSDSGIGSMYFSIYPEIDQFLKIRVSYIPLPDSQHIAVINIVTEFKKEIADGYQLLHESGFYKQSLSQYTLQGILSKYGPPTELLISIENNVGEADSPDYFYSWLLYPDLGIFLRYTSSAIVEGNTLSACPADSFVEMWLISPESSTPYQETLAYAFSSWGYLFDFPEYFKSVEDSIKMSSEEFYETYKETTNQCVEVSLDEWPLP